MKAQIYDIVRLAGLSPGEILPEVSVQHKNVLLSFASISRRNWQTSVLAFKASC